MYEVLTPTGIIEVETLREVLAYNRLFHYDYRKIVDEFEPAAVFEAEETC